MSDDKDQEKHGEGRWKKKSGRTKLSRFCNSNSESFKSQGSAAIKNNIESILVCKQ